MYFNIINFSSFIFDFVLAVREGFVNKTYHFGVMVEMYSNSLYFSKTS